MMKPIFISQKFCMSTNVFIFQILYIAVTLYVTVTEQLPENCALYLL